MERLLTGAHMRKFGYLTTFIEPSLCWHYRGLLRVPLYHLRLQIHQFAFSLPFGCQNSKHVDTSVILKVIAFRCY